MKGKRQSNWLRK